MFNFQRRVARDVAANMLSFFLVAKTINEDDAKTNEDLRSYVTDYVKKQKIARVTPIYKIEQDLLWNSRQDAKAETMKVISTQVRDGMREVINARIKDLETNAKLEKGCVSMCDFIVDENKLTVPLVAVLHDLDGRIGRNKRPTPSIEDCVDIAATHLDAYKKSGFGDDLTPFEKKLAACYVYVPTTPPTTPSEDEEERPEPDTKRARV